MFPNLLAVGTRHSVPVNLAANAHPILTLRTSAVPGLTWWARMHKRPQFCARVSPDPSFGFPDPSRKAVDSLRGMEPL